MSTHRRRRMAVVTALALGGGAALTSCSGVSPATAPAGQELSAQAAPIFDSCADLRAWYVRAALPRVTAWGLEQPYAFAADMGFVAAARTDALAAVGNGDTGTNLQEQDVDEADFAKTDGELVVLIDGRDLVVTDVSGSVPQELGRLALPPRLRSGELLLDGDKAVVLGSARRLYSGVASGSNLSRIAAPAASGPARTLMAIIDLGDPTTPVLDRLERVEGELLTAREHDGTVRVVVSAAPELPFVTPGRHRSSRQALVRNREIVRNATAQDWLPLRSTLGRTGKRPLLDCADVVRPGARSTLGVVTVLTLDADDPDGFAATGLAADSDLVYASADRMYVATAADPFVWGPVIDSIDTALWRPATSQIHAFDITGTQTAYVATGRIRGTVADRWSFSEHEGLLRVAATQGNGWRPTQTVISVLREEGNRLVVSGRVGGLGVHEQLKAVRWFGDLGVVVTFRQVDPLYTVDLSDEQHPRVTGTLKIPGYSAYLHPLGDDILLGIGQDATASGSTRGPQGATFDLSDARQPRQLDNVALAVSGFSPVERDARAFSYLPGERLALIPVSDWRNGTIVVALHITPSGELRRAGATTVPGPSHRSRMLPLDDTRVALVGRGEVTAVVDAQRL